VDPDSTAIHLVGLALGCLFLAACLVVQRRRSVLVLEGETILTGEAVVVEGESVLERHRIRREGKRL